MACTCHVPNCSRRSLLLFAGARNTLTQGTLPCQVLMRSTYVLSPSCSSPSVLRPAHANTESETNTCCTAVLACAGSLSVQDIPRLPSGQPSPKIWPLAVTGMSHSLRHSCCGQNLKAVAKISEMAKARGVTAGQLALAWVHSRGKDVIPIPGMPCLSGCTQHACRDLP